jgi:hypothetical protein
MLPSESPFNQPKLLLSERNGRIKVELEIRPEDLAGEDIAEGDGSTVEEAILDLCVDACRGLVQWRGRSPDYKRLLASRRRSAKAAFDSEQRDMRRQMQEASRGARSAKKGKKR